MMITMMMTMNALSTRIFSITSLIMLLLLCRHNSSSLSKEMEGSHSSVCENSGLLKALHSFVTMGTTENPMNFSNTTFTDSVLLFN
jgi:preprotein translocase subunit SecG